MESVFIAVLLAASPMAASGENAGAALDRQCFGLMASLAGDDDPRLSAAGRVAAQYFLGRIDAAAPGFAIDDLGPVPTGAGRERLLRQCGEEMQRAGHDFRAIGGTLAPPRPST